MPGLIAAVVIPPIMLAGVVGLVATQFWTPKFKNGEILVAHEGDIGHVDFHTYVANHNVVCTPRAVRDHALSFNGIPRCHQSKPGPDVDVVVAGDSHAEHLFLGLEEALPEHNVAYYIVDGLPTRANADFARILDHIAARTSIKTVVYTAYWGGRGVPEKDLADALRTLVHAGKTVFVTDDVPNFRFDPFGCKYKSAFLLPSVCSDDASDFGGRHAAYYPQLVRTIQQVPGVHLLNTAKYFCDETRCDMTLDGKLMYRDGSHLNMNGSRYVAKQMLNDNPDFRAAVTAPH